MDLERRTSSRETRAGGADEERHEKRVETWKKKQRKRERGVSMDEVRFFSPW